MGNGAFKKTGFKIGEASLFYWACKEGDIAAVRQMLPNMTYEQVNQLEPLGSTALHAAVFYNHPHIVQLLLENGCSRTTLNRHGATAYEEASTDEIRALFNRPASGRFVDEHMTQTFQLANPKGNSVDMKDGIPDDWFKGHTTANTAYESQFMHAIADSSGVFKKLVQNRIEAESKEQLEQLVSRTIPNEHQQYENAKRLHEKVRKKSDMSSLLTMYTLETPLYRTLQNEADSFATLIYLHLAELKDRAYKGRAYRGGRMTENDIQAYRWALQRPEQVLETRTIQSMSLNESVARRFTQSERPRYDRRNRVILIFDFSETCPTAINLNRISEKLPALSVHQDEEEVLLLPFTLFSVREIKVDSKNGEYRITLTYIPTPKVAAVTIAHNLKE
ncbi:unnamed protein product [Adineta ricciae]|uniref:Uncharacterized protein n=1 Tax=Adineta ricciae TaxID=249248 RepID=A0A815CZQ0_ADIRI|nr:unnamed protein product [Adineta ricciae]CAF1290787.1 unnamed protein product [Adineta ricciae]